MNWDTWVASHIKSGNDGVTKYRHHSSFEKDVLSIVEAVRRQAVDAYGDLALDFDLPTISVSCSKDREHDIRYIVGFQDYLRENYTDLVDRVSVNDWPASGMALLRSAAWDWREVMIAAARVLAGTGSQIVRVRRSEGLWDTGVLTVLRKLTGCRVHLISSPETRAGGIGDYRHVVLTRPQHVGTYPLHELFDRFAALRVLVDIPAQIHMPPGLTKTILREQVAIDLSRTHAKTVKVFSESFGVVVTLSLSRRVTQAVLHWAIAVIGMGIQATCRLRRALEDLPPDRRLEDLDADVIMQGLELDEDLDMDSNSLDETSPAFLETLIRFLTGQIIQITWTQSSNRNISIEVGLGLDPGVQRARNAVMAYGCWAEGWNHILELRVIDGFVTRQWLIPSEHMDPELPKAMEAARKKMGKYGTRVSLEQDNAIGSALPSLEKNYVIHLYDCVTFRYRERTEGEWLGQCAEYRLEIARLRELIESSGLGLEPVEDCRSKEGQHRLISLED